MLTAAYTGGLASVSTLLDTTCNSYFSDGYRAKVIPGEASQILFIYGLRHEDSSSRDNMANLSLASRLHHVHDLCL